MASAQAAIVARMAVPSDPVSCNRVLLASAVEVILCPLFRLQIVNSCVTIIAASESGCKAEWPECPTRLAAPGMAEAWRIPAACATVPAQLKLWRETMQEAHLLSPRQAAAQLEISTRTLRRWSTAFGSALGSAARRKGKRRGYTSQDIQTLRLAQQGACPGPHSETDRPGAAGCRRERSLNRAGAQPGS